MCGYGCWDTAVPNRNTSPLQTHLLIGTLGLRYSSVIVIPDGNLPGQPLVNGSQPFREDVQACWTRCFPPLLQNLLVQLITFSTQVLNTCTCQRALVQSFIQYHAWSINACRLLMLLTFDEFVVVAL